MSKEYDCDSCPSLMESAEPCVTCQKEDSEHYFLKQGDVAYATGVFIRWNGKWWEVVNFEDDTYHDGALVEDIENKPYI